MAKRQSRPSKKPARKKRPAKRAFHGLEGLVPPEWRHSPAWEHFRAALVEFLNGVHILLKEALERLKSHGEQERELQRIQVEK